MLEEPRFERRVVFNVNPDKIDGFLTTMREAVFPKLKEAPGIRRIYLLGNSAGGNEFAVTTLWNSQSDAESFANSDARAETVELVREFLTSDMSVNFYEVKLRDINAEDLPPPESSKRASVGRKTGSSRRSKASGSRSTRQKKKTTKGGARKRSSR